MNFILFVDEILNELLHLSKVLKIKSFEKHIIEEFLDHYCEAIDEALIDSLIIAQKHELYNFTRKQLSHGHGLQTFGLIKKEDFKLLNKEVRYEILKSAIYKENRRNEKAGYYRTELIELQFIFNFFDLLVYENRTADLAAKKSLWTLPFNEMTSLEELVNIRSISCAKDSKDCVTIIVENQEINVNAFLLTNNSPVFEAMLNSNSFKEGQSRVIELPGKKYLEIVYFLQFLHSPQELGDICGKKISFIFLLPYFLFEHT